LSNYFEALSPSVPLQEVIALQNAALSWNKNIAQKGGLPPVYATAEGIDKSEAEAIREAWETQSGAENSHRLKIAGGDIKFHKLDVTPHDSEWNNAILLAMRMIFMTLGVSSSLMNDAANKTYNNVHDSRKALFTETSIPIAKRIYSAITNALQGYYKDSPRLIIPTDRIASIQEDTKALVQYLVDAVDAGIMTANEARKKLGLPKASGATADTLQNARIINNIPKVDLNG
jgi:HK97 family phage portal protein